MGRPAWNSPTCTVIGSLSHTCIAVTSSGSPTRMRHMPQALEIIGAGDKFRIPADGGRGMRQRIASARSVGETSSPEHQPQAQGSQPIDREPGVGVDGLPDNMPIVQANNVLAHSTKRAASRSPASVSDDDVMVLEAVVVPEEGDTSSSHGAAPTTMVLDAVAVSQV